MHVFNTNIFVKNRNTNEDTITYSREYNDNDIREFKSAVENLSWKEVLNETNYPEKAFDEFLRLFMDAYEAYFPLKGKRNK